MAKNTRIRGQWDDNNDDWIFDKMDDMFTKKNAKRTGLAFVGVWLGVILLNVLIWGAGIYFVFWLLNHFGVI